MMMEQETLTLLIVGFSVVMAISMGVLVFLFAKSKNKSMLWFFCQCLALIVGFYFVYTLLRQKHFDESVYSMVSEENSWNIGMTALSWTVSMFFMLMGIFQFNKGKRNE